MLLLEYIDTFFTKTLPNLILKNINEHGIFGYFGLSLLKNILLSVRWLLIETYSLLANSFLYTGSIKMYNTAKDYLTSAATIFDHEVYITVSNAAKKGIEMAIQKSSDFAVNTAEPALKAQFAHIANRPGNVLFGNVLLYYSFKELINSCSVIGECVESKSYGKISMLLLCTGVNAYLCDRSTTTMITPIIGIAETDTIILSFLMLGISTVITSQIANEEGFRRI